MNTKELWEKCLSEIELSISKANFTTWFKNTSIVKEESGTLFVGVPNEKSRRDGVPESGHPSRRLTY